MIEKYFIKGITFSWTPPSSVEPPARDGAIVRSGTSHPPALTMTGIDTEIKYGHSVPPIGFGLAPGAIVPHRWLNYVLGRTAYVGAVNSDVLTGFMSGCRICLWTEGGHRRVGHIGTVSDAKADEPPNTTVKTAFAASPAGHVNANLQGYNPALAWDFPGITKVMSESKGKVLNPKVMSLVTAQNKFYSVLMIQKGYTNTWVCGGKKLIPATDRATMLQELA